jgi:proteasome lid subunit RPN8/RPN11
MLRLGRAAYLEVIAHALDDLPLEACGLLVAREGGHAVEVAEVHRCRNAAASARLYEVDTRDLGRVNWNAIERGMEIVGVYHSHTHTDAYPSPTDVAQAADQDPFWHYVVVSLRHPEPVVRSFRIVDGQIDEEPVVVDGR